MLQKYQSLELFFWLFPFRRYCKFPNFLPCLIPFSKMLNRKVTHFLGNPRFVSTDFHQNSYIAYIIGFFDKVNNVLTFDAEVINSSSI